VVHLTIPGQHIEALKIQISACPSKRGFEAEWLNPSSQLTQPLTILLRNGIQHHLFRGGNTQKRTSQVQSLLKQ
jgi:hypothetical protein